MLSATAAVTIIAVAIVQVGVSLRRLSRDNPADYIAERTAMNISGLIGVATFGIEADSPAFQSAIERVCKGAERPFDGSDTVIFVLPHIESARVISAREPGDATEYAAVVVTARNSTGPGIAVLNIGEEGWDFPLVEVLEDPEQLPEWAAPRVKGFLASD